MMMKVLHITALWSMWSGVQSDRRCRDWRVDYTNTAYEECAVVTFQLRAKAVLSCTGLVVQVMDTGTNRSFSSTLCLPEAQNFVAFKSEYDYTNHSCTLEVSTTEDDNSLTDVEYCQFQIQSFFGRILPSCSVNKSLPISPTDVREDEGMILLRFNGHDSDMIAIYNRDSTLDKDNQLLNNVVALSRETETLLSIDYQPDCDNPGQPGTNGRPLEVYQFCQGGTRSILTIEPNISNKVLTQCHGVQHYDTTVWLLMIAVSVLVLQLLVIVLHMTTLLLAYAL